ncbi:hypothetical protein C8R44DRAFT_674241 [Mycena epipterygia]|nr:hypothetical protein C8R44DRAFT_674241 [Mycena epipterygia]
MSNAHTASPSPSPAAFVLEPPFNNTSSADTILRSSDGVDFYVHRTVLSLVSPVFETMFALPQSDGAPAIPVIDLEENSAVLDRALRVFYPATQPTHATLDELQGIIEVLVSKYDMQCLIPVVKQHLERYIVTQPLAVYTIALRYRWEDVGKAAAKESLKLPLRALNTEAPPELKGITGEAYHNLLHYHYQCGYAAQRTTWNLEWLPVPPTSGSGEIAFGCNSCHQSSVNRRFSNNVDRRTVSWVLDYLKQMGDVLAITPGINIREHYTLYSTLTKAGCSYCTVYHFVHFATSQWPNKLKEELDKVELKF